MAGRGDGCEESLASVIPVYCTLAIGVDLGDGRGPEAEAAGLIVVTVQSLLGDLLGRFVDGDPLRILTSFLVLERPVDVDEAHLRGPGFRRLRGRRRRFGQLLRQRELEFLELFLQLGPSSLLL